MAQKRTCIDELHKRLDSAAVCRHADVLKDEGAVEEEDVVLVRVKCRGEDRAGGKVGGGTERGADVEFRARHRLGAERLAQELDVRDLIRGDLLRQGLENTWGSEPAACD